MGVAMSAIFLGEPVSTSLISSMAMILGGIAIGTIPARANATDRNIAQPDVVRV